MGRFRLRFFGTLFNVAVWAVSPMAGLSVDQVAVHASHGGFRGRRATLAVAVAMAESGGDPRATGHNRDGSIDRGLWQINSRWHKEVTDACAFNPDCAARSTFRISSGGTNWSQWAAFTNGSYRRYMAAADKAVSGVKPGGTAAMNPDGDGSGSSLNYNPLTGFGIPNAAGDLAGGVFGAIKAPFEMVARFFGYLTDPQTWIRVGLTAGGAVLIGLGLLTLLRGQAGAAMVKKMGG